MKLLTESDPATNAKRHGQSCSSRFEVLNALLVGERRNRITPELIQSFIADLKRLLADVDDGATPDVVFDTTQALCRKHGLTAYDAAYLRSPYVTLTH
jgi:predicted nucleic acid-binding protein